jgi:hypothetical protein
MMARCSSTGASAEKSDDDAPMFKVSLAVKKMAAIEAEMAAVQKSGGGTLALKRLRELEAELDTVDVGDLSDSGYSDSDNEEDNGYREELESLDRELEQLERQLAQVREQRALRGSSGNAIGQMRDGAELSLLELENQLKLVDVDEAAVASDGGGDDAPAMFEGRTLDEIEEERVEHVATLAKRGIDAESFLAAVDPLTMDPSVLPGPLADIVSKLQHDIAELEPIADAVQATRAWQEYRHELDEQRDALWQRYRGTPEEPMAPIEHAQWSGALVKLIARVEEKHVNESVDDGQKFAELMTLAPVQELLDTERRRHEALSDDARAMLASSDDIAPEPTHQVHRVVDDFLDDLELDEKHEERKLTKKKP